MEEEKKKMSKETKKLLIIISSFIAVVIIVGIVFGVVFPQLNKKEVQTSSQLENENIQEDTIKEQTNKTLLTKEMLSQDNYKLLFGLIQLRIAGEEYSSEGDYLNLAVRHQYENKFIVHTIILSSKHITEPDYQLKSVLSNSEYEKMYYLTKNITKEKIYYACFELKDNVYLEDIKDVGYTNGFETMFNIQGENIVNIPNGTDDYTTNQIAQRVANELDRYYEKLKNNEPIDTSSSTNTSSNTNSTVVADIQDRIEFFNSYYAWNFHPTDEQMQQMVEFANSTSNFTNDTLADFIIDKGWKIESETGTGNNNSSTTSNNNNNSSSSNSNNNKKVKYTHKAISGCELVKIDSSADWVKYIPKCTHCGTKEKSNSGDFMVCNTLPREYIEGTYKDSFHCVECGKNYDIIITITETYE